MLTHSPFSTLAVQAKKFVALDGASEQQGDLKVCALPPTIHAHPFSCPSQLHPLTPPCLCAQSVVLHSMKLQHVKSSFPLAVGAEISAVDNDCFSSTGKSFSFIALGNAESSTEKTLQEDDISLAYDFANKFPGYTAECAAFRAPPLRFAPLTPLCLRSQEPLGEGHPRSSGPPLRPRLGRVRTQHSNPFLQDRTTHPLSPSPAATRSCPRYAISQA